MSFISNSVIHATKLAADTIGIVAESAKFILEVFNPQNMNLFEMILIPEIYSTPGSSPSIGQLAHAGVDTLISTVCIQTIEVPFMSFETERVGNMSIISDVIYPEEITITYIENELGVVRDYLTNWQEQIMTLDKNALGNFAPLGGTETETGWIFEDNQEFAKKKAIIIPQMTTGLPSTAWVEIRGLRLKAMEPWTFDQKESEPMHISVTCSCDNIWIKSAF